MHAPSTFRYVSCCPANEASGRSSAVALERTATVICRLGDTSCPFLDALSASAALSCRYAAATSAASASGSGASVIQPRMASPVRRSACGRGRASALARSRSGAEYDAGAGRARRALVSATSRFASASAMRLSSLASDRKRRNASAVVAKPSGTCIVRACAPRRERRARVSVGCGNARNNASPAGGAPARPWRTARGPSRPATRSCRLRGAAKRVSDGRRAVPARARRSRADDGHVLHAQVAEEAHIARRRGGRRHVAGREDARSRMCADECCADDAVRESAQGSSVPTHIRAPLSPARSPWRA